MAIIPAEPSTIFWTWSRLLGELIFWATDPDPATTTSDGCREQFRNDIRDKGDRARDASPDDVTRNQVIRSRSLALQLVRMLNETPELNATPCRNWSQVDRLVVEQLAELQSQFAKLGDGKGNEPPAQRPTEKPPTDPDDAPQWDKPTEGRNQWLYMQCHKGTKYDAILRELKTKSAKWQPIVSISGVKKAANAYATRKKLKPIPRRGAGRPKQK